MERQELDKLLSSLEVLLNPKIETLVDYLELCPLPNLLQFQQCINELVESKKNGNQTPDLKHKKWYIDERTKTKYLELQGKYFTILQKYLELLAQLRVYRQPDTLD